MSECFSNSQNFVLGHGLWKRDVPLFPPEKAENGENEQETEQKGTEQKRREQRVETSQKKTKKVMCVGVGARVIRLHVTLMLGDPTRWWFAKFDHYCMIVGIMVR